MTIENDYNAIAPHSYYYHLTHPLNHLPAHHTWSFFFFHLSTDLTLLHYGITGAVNPTDATLPTQDTWLKEWQGQIADGPQSVQVPDSACAIHTPLIHSAWSQALAEYPDQTLAQFFLKGITEGFRIGYSKGTGHDLKSARKNLEGATQHPQVVDDYLEKERSLNRVAGPYNLSQFSPIPHISRFGVIPKSHQEDKWRLIIDLSHPKGHSVNDGIAKSLCSLTYVTVDDAIQKILELGRNTLLAKADIRSAFRLLPVHPLDRHLLGMRWQQDIFIDTCLPFGLRSAPKLFNILADLLSWSVTQRGCTFVIHYLDDYLTMGPPGSPVCHHNLELLKETCKDLGVPLAMEKLEGPTTSLTFLGVVLDTARAEIRLPEDKFLRIRQEVFSWLGKRRATKRQILSLAGLLQHATKVVKPGRSFVSRMYATAARVKELDFYTRLGKEFRSDLAWWHTFLARWNGLSLLRSGHSPTPPDYIIQTDASGSWGCGAFLQGSWFQWQWPSDWAPMSIMAKELVPILLSAVTWGYQLAKRVVLFQCDNLSLVTAISKGSSKDPKVMQLLRCLSFFVAFFDIELRAEHIAGVDNIAADHLSRNNTQSFFSLQIRKSPIPDPLPPPLIQMVRSPDLDWTSPRFIETFNATISWVGQNPPGNHTPPVSGTT